MATVSGTSGRSDVGYAGRVAVVALANAVAVVAIVLYLACALLSFVAPDLYLGIVQSWVHAISITPLRAGGGFELGQFLFGLVTFAAVTWVVTAAIAWLYDRWAS